jgi:hypothetical protein
MCWQAFLALIGALLIMLTNCGFGQGRASSAPYGHPHAAPHAMAAAYYQPAPLAVYGAGMPAHALPLAASPHRDPSPFRQRQSPARRQRSQARSTTPDR